MSSIAINTVCAANVLPASIGTPPSQATSSSVLPPANLPGGDALECLYAVLAKDRELGVRGAASDLKYGQKLRREAIQRQKAAIAKAVRAKKKGGFWKKLGKTCKRVAGAATVVASVALAVGTAGAATPVAVLAIAGATMSAAAFAQGELHVLEKFGVDDSWAAKIETGLEMGSMACSIGAIGAQALSSEVASKASETVDVVSRVSVGVAGASEAASGVAKVETGKYEAEAQEAYADALQARLDNKAVERHILAVLDALEESERSDERAEGLVRKTIEIKSATLVSASGRA